MLNIAKTVVRNENWRSSFAQHVSGRLSLIYDSRWSIIILLTISTGMALLTLYAYAPARGADGSDYFLHAAFLAGRSVPANLAANPPLIPILISLFQYYLNKVYFLVGLQIFMGIILPVVFYLGIRRISPFLAFVIALIIAGDTQIRVVFNFVATEPFYIFLMSLAFYLLLAQVQKKSEGWLLKGDVALAIVLALLIYTRTVARLIILPFLLVFALSTRQWRRSVILLAIHLTAWVGFTTTYRLVFPGTEAVVGTSNEVQISIPLFRSNLLHSEDGPASARIIALYQQCQGDEFEIPVRCMMAAAESETEVLRLFNQALREMIVHHPIDYGIQVFNGITDFLKLPGRQYDDSPALAQCEQDLESLADRETQIYLQNDWLLTQTGTVDQNAFRVEILEIDSQMCPPWPESTSARQVVDSIAHHYNSISRPDPWTWYAVLVLGLILIPWSRRLFPLAAGAFLILMYHAGINAFIFNVQPRYVMVMNPYKEILLVIIVYIAGHLILRFIDEIVAVRAKQMPSN